jgi:hypothetical protein
MAGGLGFDWWLVLPFTQLLCCIACVFHVHWSFERFNSTPVVLFKRRLTMQTPEKVALMIWSSVQSWRWQLNASLNILKAQLPSREFAFLIFAQVE